MLYFVLIAYLDCIRAYFVPENTDASSNVYKDCSNLKACLLPKTSIDKKRMQDCFSIIFKYLRQVI